MLVIRPVNCGQTTFEPEWARKAVDARCPQFSTPSGEHMIASVDNPMFVPIRAHVVPATTNMLSPEEMTRVGPDTISPSPRGE